MGQAPDPPQPLTLIASGLAALRAREDDINRMNVFPVPDGDTGTNMVLTMQAVVAECAKVDPGDLSAIANAATDGSLMGARGNSGVILSQVIRGLAEVIGPKGRVDIPTMVEALADAARVTMQAIRKPVAGTMLTVMEDTAAAAAELAQQPMEARDFEQALLAKIWASVERTPLLLPVLAEAGVVDAGGFGLAVLAEGMIRASLGEMPEEHMDLVTEPTQLSEAREAEQLEYTYCTEFLVKGSPPSAADARKVLDKMGGSLLVVGQPGLLKVHVHTNDPGAALSYFAPFGTFAEVHINNMEEQTSERRAQLEGAARIAASQASPEPAAAPVPVPASVPGPLKPLAVIAVAAGKGISDIMRDLGAAAIVPGGQSMNPSSGEIAAAARETGAANVIVLPNNDNVILAAQQAGAGLDKERDAGKPEPRLIIVGSETVPEGIAALLAFDETGEPDEVARRMEEELAHVTSGAVTTAVRDSSSEAGPIRMGDVLGIADSEIKVVGSDVATVASDLASMLRGEASEAETLTLLAGADLTDEAAASLAAAVSERLPDLAVEWHRGDQPLYPVLIGIE